MIDFKKDDFDESLEDIANSINEILKMPKKEPLENMQSKIPKEESVSDVQNEMTKKEPGSNGQNK